MESDVRVRLNTRACGKRRTLALASPLFDFLSRPGCSFEKGASARPQRTSPAPATPDDRKQHTMASCVTPGGVRRIRESIDGTLSDVSVQVRASPDRRRVRGKFELIPFEKALLAPPGIVAPVPRAIAHDATRRTALGRSRLIWKPPTRHSQVLNLKSDADAGFRCVRRPVPTRAAYLNRGCQPYPSRRGSRPPPHSERD